MHVALHVDRRVCDDRGDLLEHPERPGSAKGVTTAPSGMKELPSEKPRDSLKLPWRLAPDVALRSTLRFTSYIYFIFLRGPHHADGSGAWPVPSYSALLSLSEKAQLTLRRDTAVTRHEAEARVSGDADSSAGHHTGRRIPPSILSLPVCHLDLLSFSKKSLLWDSKEIYLNLNLTRPRFT